MITKFYLIFDYKSDKTPGILKIEEKVSFVKVENITSEFSKDIYIINHF